MKRKYGIFPQVSGVVIGKLNKANTEFLDKEYLEDGEVMQIIVNLAKHIQLVKGGNRISITANGKEELVLNFPELLEKRGYSEFIGLV